MWKRARHRARQWETGMSDEQAPDAPDPARDGALRALAENPTVRPSIRVAARMALR